MEEFYVPEGIWFVMDVDSFRVDPQTGRIIPCENFAVCAVKYGQRSCVAAFTDEDLAERYVASQGDPSLVKSLANHDAILEVLENCRAGGFGFVAFDPIPNPRIIPIDAVIEAVKKGRA